MVALPAAAVADVEDQGVLCWWAHTPSRPSGIAINKGFRWQLGLYDVMQVQYRVHIPHIPLEPPLPGPPFPQPNLTLLACCHQATPTLYS